MDSLRKLPEGAAYTKKSGQATLALRLKGDSIQGIATCDSLQQLVYEQEELLRQAHDRLEQKEIIKKAPEFTLKCYLTGLVTGFMTLLIFQFIRKWTKKQDRLD